MMLHRTLTSAAVILTLGVGSAAMAADNHSQSGQAAQNQAQTQAQKQAQNQGQSQAQNREQTAAGADQDRTRVTVDQAPAEAQVTQPAPDVTVVDPEPRVKVETQKPQVSVNQPEPEVEVDQAKPDVDINRTGQPDVTIKETSPARSVQTGQNTDTQTRDDQMRKDQALDQNRSDTDSSIDRQQMQTSQGQGVQNQQGQGMQGQAIAGRELIGKEVMGQNGEAIGEVSDVIVSDAGLQQVIIERGGFLGMGEKQVAVDMDKLSVSPDGISLDMTDQQLSQMPDYEDQGAVNPDTIEARPVVPEADQQTQ